jgi:NADH-quinone oxidoreductase subunit G
VASPEARTPDADSRFILATWPTLLDAGRLQDGEPFLAGTAPRAVARLSATDAERLGVVDGDPVAVSSARGSVTVPVLVTDRMVDGVVWLPTNSVGCAVRTELGVEAGAPVDVARSASPVSPAELGTASPSAQTSEANVDPIPRVTPESSERPPR